MDQNTIKGLRYSKMAEEGRTFKIIYKAEVDIKGRSKPKRWTETGKELVEEKNLRF